MKPNDVSVFSTLGINGRLFACPRDQLNGLVSASEASIKWVYANSHFTVFVEIIAQYKDCEHGAEICVCVCMENYGF